MTDLPKNLRTQFSEKFGSILQGKEITRQKSEDSSQKLLIEWQDSERIECVLLHNTRHHRTACVSVQVGCQMKCIFCASGMDGFVRNLTRGEILEQLLRLNALLPSDERLTHIVVMGIGEPMLNLDSLLSSLDDATSADGFGIGVRRVTISTVGIPAGIRKLAESNKGYNLAVSLHASNDELRSQIIPNNPGIAEILRATDEFFQKTGRQVTFEYTLIEGVNDLPEHVIQLADLLRSRAVVVNVIPLNPVPALAKVGQFYCRAPSGRSVQRFVSQLEQHGIQVNIRFRKGDKIAAACGQLRCNQQR